MVKIKYIDSLKELKGRGYMSFLAIGSFIFFTVLVAIVSWYFTREEDLSTNQGYFLGGEV